MTLYTPQHYENKLLLAEKTTIEKALKRENGSIKKAYNLLCPKGYYYTYNALLRVMRRHGIKKENFKK